jgi:hypothetical protein
MHDSIPDPSVKFDELNSKAGSFGLGAVFALHVGLVFLLLEA